MERLYDGGEAESVETQAGGDRGDHEPTEHSAETGVPVLRA